MPRFGHRVSWFQVADKEHNVPPPDAHIAGRRHSRLSGAPVQGRKEAVRGDPQSAQSGSSFARLASPIAVIDFGSRIQAESSIPASQNETRLAKLTRQLIKYNSTRSVVQVEAPVPKSRHLPYIPGSRSLWRRPAPANHRHHELRYAAMPVVEALHRAQTQEIEQLIQGRPAHSTGLDMSKKLVKLRQLLRGRHYKLCTLANAFWPTLHDGLLFCIKTNALFTVGMHIAK